MITTHKKKRPFKPENHTIASWILISTVVLFSAVLRFYTLPETIQFYDDQGLDMVSILQMEQVGEIPLVGPLLSIPDFYTPPTYYLIIQFFYNITRTVIGIVYGFALINLITVLIFILLTHAMMGMRAAVIMSILAGTSNIMIDHSRYFWQPHPVQLFLALWLLFLWWAYKEKQIFFLVLSSLCFQVALSIYPSPIILFPLAFVLIYSWFLIIRKSSRSLSVFSAGVTLGITFIGVFSSQILFETSRGFPTLKSILLTPKIPGTFPPLTGITENATAFITAFLATTKLPHPAMVTTTCVLGTIAFVLYRETRKKQTRHHLPVFWPVWAFIIGFGIFALVPLETNLHRSTALLPLALLFSTEILSRAFEKTAVTRLLAVIFLGSYIILNLYGAKWYWDGQAQNGVERTKRVARYILTDMQLRHVPESSAEFFYKIPNDPYNGSYGIYRILFWLIRDGGISYPLSKENFQMPHNYSNPQYKPYLYVICRGFTSTLDIEQNCIRPVTASHKYQQIGGETFENISVVILHRVNEAIHP